MFYFKSFIFCFSFLFCHLSSAGEFHEAIKRGRLDKIKPFLDQGVDVNAPDEEGNAPLIYAAIHLSGPELQIVLGWFVEKGVDVNALSGEARPLHWAAGEQSLEEVKLLVAAGAKVNALDGRGNNALHWAASNTNTPHPEETVEFFIDQGLDVNLQNNVTGWTPLHAALYMQRYNDSVLEKMTRDLLEADANPYIEAYDEFRSPVEMVQKDPEAYERIRHLFD